MNRPILAPVVTLIAWSLIVLLWVVTTRGPALKAAGIDLSAVRGGKPGFSTASCPTTSSERRTTTSTR